MLLDCSFKRICPQTFHTLVVVLTIYVCMRYSPQRCGSFLQYLDFAKNLCDQGLI